jgi:3-oxoacyl-[acyl-carrier-protein] synthase-3
MPISPEVLDQKLCYVQMNGREVFKRAVRCMADVSEQVLDQAGLSVDDVDWVIPHQANIRIIQSVASRINISIEKFYLNLSKVGNVSAASVPIAIDEAARSGVLKRGDVVLLTVMGAGFTWGATVLEW